MKKIHFFAIALMAVFASCGSSEKLIIQGIPYQEEDGDRWSMVATDGSVIFEDEFKLEPTLMSCDRFFVKNSKDLYDLYKMDGENAEMLESGFKEVSVFCGGRAVVARKGQPVSIIDTEGKEIKKLDKIAGKTVERVSPFYFGTAVFTTIDGKEGVIDMDGKCIVKPEYKDIEQGYDGYYVAERGNDSTSTSFDLLSPGGKKLFSKKMGDGGYSQVGRYSDGMLPVATGEYPDRKWGILDKDGKELIKPSEKYDDLVPIEGGRIMCEIDGECGLLDKEGKMVVRPKYERMDYVGNNMCIARRDDDECFLIDKDGERVGDTKFEKPRLIYVLTDGETMLVRKERNDYRLLDGNGNQIEDAPDMEYAEENHGLKNVDSDYIDVEALFSSLNIRTDGVLSFNYNTTPEEAVSASNSYNQTPDNYLYDSKVTVEQELDNGGTKCEVTIEFSSEMAERTYTTEEYYDYWEEKTMTREVPDGYAWSNARPVSFGMEVEIGWKLNGKEENIYEGLVKLFSRLGEKVDEVTNDYEGEERVTNFTLKDGSSAWVMISEKYGSKTVSASWGKGFETESDYEEAAVVVEEADTIAVQY